jgi:hypothetical protein
LDSWNAAPIDPAVYEADHGDPSRSGSRKEDGNAGPGRKEAGSRKGGQTVPGALEYGRIDDFQAYCVRYPYSVSTNFFKMFHIYKFSIFHIYFQIQYFTSLYTNVPR